MRKLRFSATYGRDTGSFCACSPANGTSMRTTYKWVCARPKPSKISFCFLRTGYQEKETIFCSVHHNQLNQLTFKINCAYKILRFFSTIFQERLLCAPSARCAKGRRNKWENFLQNLPDFAENLIFFFVPPPAAWTNTPRTIKNNNITKKKPVLLRLKAKITV